MPLQSNLLQKYSNAINYKCLGLKYLVLYSSFHGKKQGNVSVNNTFYLRLYGVGHMVMDDSDSERGNLFN